MPPHAAASNKALHARTLKRAQLLEYVVYHRAPSFQAYSDLSTLPTRLTQALDYVRVCAGGEGSPIPADLAVSAGGAGAGAGGAGAPASKVGGLAVVAPVAAPAPLTLPLPGPGSLKRARSNDVFPGLYDCMSSPVGDDVARGDGYPGSMADAGAVDVVSDSGVATPGVPLPIMRACSAEVGVHPAPAVQPPAALLALPRPLPPAPAPAPAPLQFAVGTGKGSHRILVPPVAAVAGASSMAAPPAGAAPLGGATAGGPTPGQPAPANHPEWRLKFVGSVKFALLIASKRRKVEELAEPGAGAGAGADTAAAAATAASGGAPSPVVVVPYSDPTPSPDLLLDGLFVNLSAPSSPSGVGASPGGTSSMMMIDGEAREAASGALVLASVPRTLPPFGGLQLLPQACKQWQDVAAMVKAGVPTASLLSLERVYNSCQWRRYDAELQNFADLGVGPNEALLWHGTRGSDPRDIAMQPNGLDLRVSVRDKLLYGRALYFADTPLYR